MTALERMEQAMRAIGLLPRWHCADGRIIMQAMDSSRTRRQWFGTPVDRWIGMYGIVHSPRMTLAEFCDRLASMVLAQIDARKLE